MPCSCSAASAAPAPEPSAEARPDATVLATATVLVVDDATAAKRRSAAELFALDNDVDEPVSSAVVDEATLERTSTLNSAGRFWMKDKHTSSVCSASETACALRAAPVPDCTADPAGCALTSRLTASKMLLAAATAAPGAIPLLAVILCAAVVMTCSIDARTALSVAADVVDELAARLPAMLVADDTAPRRAVVSFVASNAAVSEADALFAKVSSEDALPNTGNGGGGDGGGITAAHTSITKSR